MKEIIENIHNKIVELSDLILQRKLWLNENNDTGLISSYDELMCSLFDDFNFGEFVNETTSKIGLSDKSILQLDKLKDLLNNYDKKKSDAEIISDPEWKKVVDQAKKVLKEWNI